MTNPIKFAVFPVAGRGTRFLPATKAVPKEMLPILDKPLIQCAVEEAIAAGATKLVFITNEGKESIERHFKKDSDLESALEGAGKDSILKVVRNILPDGVTLDFINQGSPLGLGHAVLCAHEVVGDEPFFVHLPDDLIFGNLPCLAQMANEYNLNSSSIVAVEEVSKKKTSSYGIVATESAEQLALMTDIIEKPEPEDAPSNLAVVGRYLLTSSIWEKLRNTKKGAGGEIQLTDAIADLITEEDVYAYSFSGDRYDCGSKLGYLKAMVSAGLIDSDISSEFREYLKKEFISN